MQKIKIKKKFLIWKRKKSEAKIQEKMAKTFPELE